MKATIYFFWFSVVSWLTVGLCWKIPWVKKHLPDLPSVLESVDNQTSGGVFLAAGIVGGVLLAAFCLYGLFTSRTVSDGVTSLVILVLTAGVLYYIVRRIGKEGTKTQRADRSK